MEFGALSPNLYLQILYDFNFGGSVNNTYLFQIQNELGMVQVEGNFISCLFNQIPNCIAYSTPLLCSQC